jgi:hypothetical protein
VCRTRKTISGATDSFQNRRWSSGHLKMLKIKRDREQRSANRIYDMTSRNEVGITTARDQRFAVSRDQRLHDNLRFVP